MSDRPLRLGQVIEDYCPRCKLLLDHAIQALAGDTIQTVVCKTCMHNHPYRHGRVAKKKSAKASLFEQILAKKPPTKVISIPTTKKPSSDEASRDEASRDEGGDEDEE